MRKDWRLPRWLAWAPERFEFAAVLLATLLTFGLSSALELRERMTDFLARGEAWQVDEIPFTLMAQSLQEGVRRLVRRLRPAELDQLGLVEAMQSLCEAWTTRSGVPCLFHARGKLCENGEVVDTTVYRVAQEALANVVRHANATRVDIELAATPEGLSLRVEDDGRGFSLVAPERGFGLLGATERAAALGGRLVADSAPGAGTRIHMQLPPAPELRREAA
jgi:two-component system sensor histidine kinase UhpB